MEQGKITHTKTRLGQTKTIEKIGYYPGEHFEFSKKDKSELLSMLQKFKLVPKWNNENEGLFFLMLQHLCTQRKWRESALTREAHREKITDIEKSFKKTIRYLKAMENTHIPSLCKPAVSFNDSFDDNIKNAEAESKMLHKARNALKNLELLLKMVQNHAEPKIKKGENLHRPTTNFCIEVIELLMEFFNNVPLKRHKNSFFKQFCETLLKMMDITYKDISRSCLTAIDKIQSSLK